MNDYRLVRISHPLVAHCIKEGILSQLAYFLRFKYKYKNSCYYGYNVNRLARSTNHSHRHISKYLQFYMDRKWVREHHGNLIFKSLPDIMKIEDITSRRRETMFLSSLNLREIKLRLKRVIFDNNLAQQRYAIKKRADLSNYPTGESPWTGVMHDDLLCTVKGIGQMLKCSIATSSRIKKAWSEFGWYKFIRNIKLVDPFMEQQTYRTEWQPYVDKTIFWFKGSMYLTLPSIVCILE